LLVRDRAADHLFLYGILIVFTSEIYFRDLEKPTIDRMENIIPRGREAIDPCHLNEKVRRLTEKERKRKDEGQLKKYSIKRGRIKTKRMFEKYILVYQKGKKIIIIRAAVRGAKNTVCRTDISGTSIRRNMSSIINLKWRLYTVPA
jgi:hypothetical protein